MKVSITKGVKHFAASVVDSSGYAVITRSGRTKLAAMKRLSDDLMRKAKSYENMSESLEAKIMRLEEKN